MVLFVNQLSKKVIRFAKAVGMYKTFITAMGIVLIFATQEVVSLQNVMELKLTNKMHISGGYSHSAAIKNDGTVWVWGERWLDIKNKNSESIALKPEKINGLTDVKRVSAGERYTLILKNDGAVWVIDSNDNFDKETMQWKPYKLETLNDIEDISSGYDGHFIALSKAGKVYVGSVSPFYRETPNSPEKTIKLINNLTDVTKIAAGYGFSVVLKSDGTVWTSYMNFGRNPIDFPFSKISGFNDIVDISAGQSIIAAQTKDGKLITIGSDAETPLSNEAPIKKYEFSGVKDISAQGADWVALLENGTVMHGEYTLGGSLDIAPTIYKGITDAVEVAMGSGFTLILKNDGSLFAIGENGTGQLGDGTQTSRSSVVKCFFNIDPNVISSTETAPENKLDFKYSTELSSTLDSLTEKIISSLDVPANSSTYRQVYAKTAEKFLQEISPGKEIILDSEQTYDITPAINSEVARENFVIKDSFNGKELIIKNTDNLIIRSSDKKLANIIVSPTYSNVMVFENCNNVTLENISAGHGPEKGNCTGGVLVFKNCTNIKINGCRLFGCGTQGIETDGIDRLLVKDSIIEDCTYHLVTIQRSSNVLFMNTILRKTEMFDLININDARNVAFSNCQIRDNTVGGLDNSLFNIDNVSPMVIVQDTDISNNVCPFLQSVGGMIYYKDVKFSNNLFQKGISKLDKSEQAEIRKDEIISNNTGLTIDKKNSQKEISVNINGKDIVFDVYPVIVNGRTLVPVRAITEGLGCRVEWNESKKEINIMGQRMIVLHVDDKKASVVSVADVVLEVAPFIKDGRVFVPLRFIAEYLNTNVYYNSEDRSINIQDMIQDGWYIDSIGKYKIKMFKDLNFGGRIIKENDGDFTYSETSTTPIRTDEDLSMPVKGLRGSYRILLKNQNYSEQLNELIKELSMQDKFKILEKTSDTYLLNQESILSNSDKRKRIAVTYIKYQKDSILVSFFDAVESYYLEFKDEIIDNLKSIKQID